MHRSSSTSSFSEIKKFGLHLAVFAGMVFALDFVLGKAAEHYFFKTYDGDTGGAVNGLLAKRSDVVVFGSSRAESHYVPDILSASWGVSAFNAGFKGSNIIYDYGVLQLVLEAYAPKLIIYDFTSISVARGKADPYEKLWPLYPYWKNQKIWNLISERGWLECLFFVSRIYPYNSKIHSIAIFNTRKSRPGASNGYVAQTSTMIDKPLANLVSNEAFYDSKLVSYLGKFVTSAHDRGIKVIFVISPRHANGVFSIPAELQQIMKAYNIPVMDFNVADYPQFKDYQLYRDETHLNHKGASLFSKIFADRVKQFQKGV